MQKLKTSRKPGRPRLGGVVVKARLRLETHRAAATRAAAELRPLSALIADAVEAYLRAA